MRAAARPGLSDGTGRMSLAASGAPDTQWDFAAAQPVVPSRKRSAQVSFPADSKELAQLIVEGYVVEGRGDAPEFAPPAQLRQAELTVSPPLVVEHLNAFDGRLESDAFVWLARVQKLVDGFQFSLSGNHYTSAAYSAEFIKNAAYKRGMTASGAVDSRRAKCACISCH